MGNTYCSCSNSIESQNDIVYSDSSYNIWDNNPVKSQNSLNSQFSFSSNINNKVNGITKEQYAPSSPRNDQSTSQGFQDGLSQSQINTKLEQLQEMIKKQHSIIQEESEVDTIVEFPKEPQKEGKHAQPSFFSQKKLSQEELSEKNSEKFNVASFNQSEFQSNKEGQQQLQSKASFQNIQNPQSNINTQVTIDQDRAQTNPQYSLKYIKYDNNYYDEDRLFSMQFNNENKNENQIQNK